MPVDDYRKQLTRRRASARVLLDQSIIAAHAEADARLQAALGADEGGLAEPEEITALRGAVEAVEAAIAAAEIEFVFEGIGRRAWLALVAEHPPTDDERRDGYDFHPETFQRAAIVASVVSPDDVDADVVLFLANELDLAEWGKLWTACLEANLGVAVRPKSVAASVLRRTSDRSSNTAPPEGSLAASS